MTDRRAVTLQATTQLLRWGVGPDPDLKPATETEHVLSQPVIIAVGTVQRHYTVDGAGVAVLMGAAQQAIVDAATAAEQQADATGALLIQRVVANPSQLPIPPPRAGLLVGVINTGGGVPGLAMSTGVGWAIFPAGSTIP